MLVGGKQCTSGIMGHDMLWKKWENQSRGAYENVWGVGRERKAVLAGEGEGAEVEGVEEITEFIAYCCAAR